MVHRLCSSRDQFNTEEKSNIIISMFISKCYIPVDLTRLLLTWTGDSIKQQISVFGIDSNEAISFIHTQNMSRWWTGSMLRLLLLVGQNWYFFLEKTRFDNPPKENLISRDTNLSVIFWWRHRTIKIHDTSLVAKIN